MDVPLNKIHPHESMTNMSKIERRNQGSQIQSGSFLGSPLLESMPLGCAPVFFKSSRLCRGGYVGYMPPYFQMELYTVHDATWCQPRISAETCILCDIFGGEQNAEPHGHMAGRDWLMGLCLCIWKEPDRAVDEPRWPALHSEARRVLGRVLGQLWCGSRMDAAVVVWEPEC